MEGNQPRKQGGSALVTFILVLVILILSGVLIYLRYGDLMMNRLYQFTDGKIGAETGVTSLPGRENQTSGEIVDEPGADDGVTGEPGADDGVTDKPGADDGVTDKPGADDGVTDGSGEPGVTDELSDSGSGEPSDGGTPDGLSGAIPGEMTQTELAEMYYDAAKALPDGITLSTHDFTLRTLGESATVRVTGGSEGPFAWVSQNPDVAEVDSSGKITARSHGTVNVIVTDGVKKGVCVARMITGSTSETAKLNTTDFTRTVEEGEYQLKVSGVEGSITWTSEDPSVATVDENGLVIPVGKGRTRIRAAWNDGYLICVVRVPE